MRNYLMYVLFLFAFATAGPVASAEEEGECVVRLTRVPAHSPLIYQVQSNSHTWIQIQVSANNLTAVGEAEAFAYYASEEVKMGRHQDTDAVDYKFVCDHDGGHVEASTEAFSYTRGKGVWTDLLGNLALATARASVASPTQDPLALASAWALGNEPLANPKFKFAFNIQLPGPLSISIDPGGIASQSSNSDKTDAAFSDTGYGAGEMESCRFQNRSEAVSEGKIRGLGGAFWERGSAYLSVVVDISWAWCKLYCSTHGTGKRVVLFQIFGTEAREHINQQMRNGTPVPSPYSPDGLIGANTSGAGAFRRHTYP